MRFKAGAMGYSLNQRGLYAGIVRDPHDRRVKLTEGQSASWREHLLSPEILSMYSGYIVASETEQEIFKILEVPWQEPHERVRG
jgi:DNA polymerase lambda